MPVWPATKYPPNTRANEITSATRNVTAAAAAMVRESNVPRATSTAPTAVAVRYARARAGRSPPKSVMTSRAKQPKTMKMTFWPRCRPNVPSAKASGMTTAARAARRSAAKPGSRGAVSENRGCRGGAGTSLLATTVSFALIPNSYTTAAGHDAPPQKVGCARSRDSLKSTDDLNRPPSGPDHDLPGLSGRGHRDGHDRCWRGCDARLAFDHHRGGLGLWGARRDRGCARCRAQPDSHWAFAADRGLPAARVRPAMVPQRHHQGCRPRACGNGRRGSARCGGTMDGSRHRLDRLAAVVQGRRARGIGSGIHRCLLRRRRQQLWRGDHRRSRGHRDLSGDRVHRPPVRSADSAQLLAADRRDAADLVRYLLVGRRARRQLAGQRRHHCGAVDPLRGDRPDLHHGLASPGAPNAGSGLMARIWSWIVAFGRFWYSFIVGDDWTVAVAVLIGLAVTGILNANHIVGWWLMPIIVVVMTGVSVQRTSARRWDISLSAGW